jgi:NAD(P)-dependent dehydrogenase (short-subunit alcohol dehydrogenase family)
MKKYLVIGAGSGIGAATAEELHKQGHQVWSASRREQIATAVYSHQQYDVRTGGTLQLPTELDGVVYAPGSIQLKPFHRITPTQFQEEFQLNVLGAISVLQQAMPALQKSGNASVVLFSTVAVQQGMPFHTAVATAKGAVEGLVRALAAEWAPAIRVNAIAPSLTDTPLAERLLSSDEKKQASAQRHPLKKIGTATEIAKAVLYLLQAEWVTGQIIHVDGGLSAIAPL